MSISQIYSNQYRWRRWSGVYPDLGDISGRVVLDLGCGTGDQARDLSMRSVHVLDIDANQEVIDHANRGGFPGARFLCDNITHLNEHGLEFDGIWASFTVAYVPEFDQFLDGIDTVLKPGGWLSITEADDLLGHEPLAPRRVVLAGRYYRRSLEEGLYRFRSHDHVLESPSRRGWGIEIDRTLEDDEFCFTGAADSDRVDAWKTRLAPTRTGTSAPSLATSRGALRR